MSPTFPIWPTHYGSGQQFTRLWMLKPDRTLGTILDRWANFEAELLPFEAGSIGVTLPLTDRIEALSWNNIPCLENDLENYGCWFYYRDPGDGSRRVFNGIVDPVTLRHRGRRGSAYIEVEFVSAFWELMRRRQVWTYRGERWEYEDTPDNIARKIIGEQFEAGKVVIPEKSNADRTRLGHAEAPWGLTVENVKPVGDHPETLKYAVDHGTVLTDVLRELFEGRMPDTNSPTDIYPQLLESEGGSFHVNILFGKDLVDPAQRVIGRDWASDRSVVLAPERSNMIAFNKKIERLPQLTNLEIRGRRAFTGQYREFLDDPEMFYRVGDMEDSYTIQNGDSFDEIMFEARTMMAKRRLGNISYEVEIVERDGLEFPERLNVMDTVVAYSGADTFAEEKTLDVVSVKISIPAPGFPKVSIGLGQLERNPIAEMGRHGGGRGGGGGGGGRPRNKNGANNGCEDGIDTYIDEHGHEETIDGKGCGRKLQVIGDEFIDVAVRGQQPGDPGGGDADVVYVIEWCLPQCELPDVNWPIQHPQKWAIVCLKDPKTGESIGKFTVPLFPPCPDDPQAQAKPVPPPVPPNVGP